VADDNNKLISTLQPAGRAEEARGSVSLTPADILSDDALPLDALPRPAVSSVTGNDVPVPGMALQVNELLSSIDSHPSMAGGFLMFDSDSSPGQTIVRVMLDDCGSQQAFDVGIFNGVGIDLNSLLGQTPSHNGDHS
jgi:hypothetical protein